MTARVVSAGIIARIEVASGVPREMPEEAARSDDASCVLREARTL
jgi:hypothetical protein